MRATLPYMREKFRHYNALLFAGRLPEPAFELADAKTFLGQCKWSIRKKTDGSRENYAFIIRLSTRHDLQPDLLDDTLIHEMIHYFIALHNLTDTSPHGEIFKSIMRSINSTYGRRLSIRHTMTPEETESAGGERRKWHLIAVIDFRSGERGIKLLPRILPKITAYCAAVGRTPGVESVSLYLHDNPFFNRFPTSASLRYHLVDPLQLKEALDGSRSIELKDGRLIEKK